MNLIVAANPQTALVSREIERLYGAKRLSQLITLLEELETAVGPGQPGD